MPFGTLCNAGAVNEFRFQYFRFRGGACPEITIQQRQCGMSQFIYRLPDGGQPFRRGFRPGNVVIPDDRQLFRNFQVHFAADLPQLLGAPVARGKNRRGASRLTQQFAQTLTGLPVRFLHLDDVFRRKGDFLFRERSAESRQHFFINEFRTRTAEQSDSAVSRFQQTESRQTPGSPEIRAAVNMFLRRFGIDHHCRDARLFQPFESGGGLDGDDSLNSAVPAAFRQIAAVFAGKRGKGQHDFNKAFRCRQTQRGKQSHQFIGIAAESGGTADHDAFEPLRFYSRRDADAASGSPGKQSGLLKTQKRGAYGAASDVQVFRQLTLGRQNRQMVVTSCHNIVSELFFNSGVGQSCHNHPLFFTDNIP